MDQSMSTAIIVMMMVMMMITINNNNNNNNTHIILGVYPHYAPFCDEAQGGYKSMGGWVGMKACE